MTTSPSSAPTQDSAVVLMLGPPATGKRTVGEQLARQLDGVLLHNALLSRPVLELFRWDGVQPLPPTVWDYVVPIRDTVIRAIEEIAPPTMSYVFTSVIESGPDAERAYGFFRSLARRRGSMFLAVVLTCDLDEQVSRIDTPDRIAWRKGADPEGYRRYTLTTDLFQPPPAETLGIDTTHTTPTENARRIVDELHRRGLGGGAPTSTSS